MQNKLSAVPSWLELRKHLSSAAEIISGPISLHRFGNVPKNLPYSAIGFMYVREGLGLSFQSSARRLMGQHTTL